MKCKKRGKQHGFGVTSKRTWALHVNLFVKAATCPRKCSGPGRAVQRCSRPTETARPALGVSGGGSFGSEGRSRDEASGNGL